LQERQPHGFEAYIQEGKVKIAVTSDQGKEAVVAILGAGAFFGEGCLIGQVHNSLLSVVLKTSAPIPKFAS
jgi:CRP-like cAMP-binding protein